MGAPQHAEDFEDPVDRPAALLELLGLREERVQVHLRHVAAPGELQVHAQRRGRVLAREQPRAVGRQLAFAEPLEQGELDRQNGDAGEERQRGETDVEEQDQQRVIEGVPAHDVPQLVAKHVAELVVVEQLERPRLDDDERLVHPEGARVGERGLRHE